ncbi:hypothetical protein QZH41_014525 [Actinostola sp. cb2023]|nr:hypothetical protein QZH41_014525 [Actinostola sp. cb2023]
MESLLPFSESTGGNAEANMATDEDFKKSDEDEERLKLYNEQRDYCMRTFEKWTESEQVQFVEYLLSRMCHYQHGHVNAYLKPMLQRDFITALPAKGLDHIAESILSFLDAKSLCAAEVVCKEWRRVIADGMLWKKLIERKVRTDPLWQGLSERQGWGQYLFKSKVPDPPNNDYYRRLYPAIIKDLETIETNWRCGHHALHRIYCRSENSKGVYCLQYDDQKIVSGLRDNTIKPNKNIMSGPIVWNVHSGEMLNTLIHHCEAVLHLRFQEGMMVTCSKDRSIAVWDMQSPTDINLRRVLVGHRAAVNVVDFDDKYIVSASGDRTIKGPIPSSPVPCQLWDIECGACLRVLEGHEELVRCIRFDNKRIVSGAYDG